MNNYLENLNNEKKIYLVRIELIFKLLVFVLVSFLVFSL